MTPFSLPLSPFPGLRSSSSEVGSSGSRLGAWLQAYFRSGWAFFIPYLAAYLLYAWLDWPVNPGGAGSTEQGAGSSISDSASWPEPVERLQPLVSGPWSLVPSLLHVYWTLHAIHAIMAGFALWGRGRGRSGEQGARSKEKDPGDRPPVAGGADPGDSEAVAGLGEAGDRTGVDDPGYNSNLENRTGLRSQVSGLTSSPISPPSPPLPSTRCRAPSPLHSSALLPSPFSLLLKTAPWLCLGLLFWIPGIYLEWPSDPWEHLRRINEWHAHSFVTEHSSWRKSSYFLPYSLTGFTTGLTQLSWLNFYYTGICLLLSWQYYRLARAVGLSERASFVFVLISALTFGNSVFSFYRYYGLSSSIFAQIGAIALTRIVLEALSAFSRSEEKGGPPCGRTKEKEVWRREKDADRTGVTAAGYNADTEVRTGVNDPGYNPNPRGLAHPVAGLGEAGDRTGGSLLRSKSSEDQADPGCNSAPSRLPSPFSLLLRLGAAGLCLLPLIAANHPQGLGIAGLGILAVVVWRLIEWKRSMLGWLALAAVVLSVATVLWFPRHAALDEIYRPGGWLTAWYGFNLFQPSSPAFDRMMQIIGAFGLLSLIASLWLLRRNHIAGWLTLMPVLALALPCFALPFAHVIAAQTTPDNIVIFHRFLFAVPLGLAVVAAFTTHFSRTGVVAGAVLASEASPCPPEPRAKGGAKEADPGDQTVHRPPSSVLRPPSTVLRAGTALLPCALLLTLGLSPGTPTFNRFWHNLLVTSDDLQLQPHLAAWTASNLALAQKDSTLVVPSPLGAKVQEAFQRSPSWYSFRQVHGPLNSAEIEQRLDWLSVLEHPDWVAATAEIKNGTLFFIHRNTTSHENLLFVVPTFTVLRTPVSQAAQLSAHWSVQQVFIEQGGTAELWTR